MDDTETKEVKKEDFDQEKAYDSLATVINEIGETITSMVWTTGTLIDLLVEKSIISKEELMDKLNKTLEKAMATIKKDTDAVVN